MRTTRRKTQRVRTRYERNEYGRLVVVPGDPTHTANAVSWTVWHLPELTGVLAPAGIGAMVAPLASGVAWVAPGTAWLVSGVVGALWAWRAVRQAREQNAIRTGRDLVAVDEAAAPVAGSDVDTEDVGVAVMTDDDEVAVEDGSRVGAVPDTGGGVRL